MRSPLITFEEARQTVTMRFADYIDAHDLVVARDGFEDDTHWQVRIVPRSDALSAVMMDQPAILVSKATGQIIALVEHEHTDRLDAMRPVTR